MDEFDTILREMGQEPCLAALPRRSIRSRRSKKRRRFDPGDTCATDGVSGEADDRCFSECGERLDGFAHTGEVLMNGDNGAGGGMCGNSADHLVGSDVADLHGGKVVPDNCSTDEKFTDNCSADEKREEDLGGEGVLADAEAMDVGSVRKRMKVSGQTGRTAGVPLRRSARRTYTSLLSPTDAVACKTEPALENGQLFEKKLEFDRTDSKPTLPPSSSVLDVNGLPVLDLFSVYSCLRSFSRSLFLSPFRLEALVSALRCQFTNPLIDSIHFSILQALKPHLVRLMEEGSRSATECLRNLNWDLLDHTTWPLFLVEYLIFCGSSLRPNFNFAHLKLLDFEYYFQPAEVKLEILRCLCDDVVAVEHLRSELNRMVTESELILDASNNISTSKKQKFFSMHGRESFMAQEGIDDLADGNSNECCLCRMDGNLICCDGCPAAFHSRCVGMAKELLPEGEWYCPECLMDKDGVVSFSMPFKGADILGRDSHGRLYYGCCGYLLVSDSCEYNSLCHYYSKEDLNAVIMVLKSEYSSSEIVNAICSYWEIPGTYLCFNSQYECGAHNFSEILDKNKENLDVNDNKFVEGKCASMVEGSKGYETTYLTDQDGIGFSVNCITPMAGIISAKAPECFFVSTTTPTGTTPVEHADQSVRKEEYFGFSGRSCTSEKVEVVSGLQTESLSYVNYYSFGQVAAAIAEDILPKPLELNNEDSLKPDEVIKSVQLEIISKKLTQLFWYNKYKVMLNLQKEDCGWCFTCKRSSDNNCLFRTVDEKHVEGCKDDIDGSNNSILRLNCEEFKKSHLDFAMHHILSIESRIRIFLSGPWEKMHYSEQWRRAVLKACDVSSLKFLLLALESSLRRVALLPEWQKPIDSDQPVGSASFQLRDFEWWRGGKLSRQLFCWKRLPRSLASKCARQAGCKKITNMFYHDGAEFAKRNMGISWRAAVEMSKNAAEFIYLVKEFDSHIKWVEIFGNQFFLQLTKESKKIARLFKQVIMRKKCVEGTEVKYLLDFGKRETIPAIVTKHGVLLEEGSDKRKRFWLNEAYVPLALVRAFEEKKQSRLMKKKDSEQPCEKGNMIKMKKVTRMKGIAYLFSKVKNLEKQLCGHCNKDVLLREAVNCQYCDGFFHRKHFRVPKGAVVTTYTCFKCKDKESVNAKSALHKGNDVKRKASIVRKGKPISMSKKTKDNIDSDGMVASMESTVALVSKMANQSQLNMAKKSKAVRASYAKKSKGNLLSFAVASRKNPVRLVRKMKRTAIYARRPNLNLKRRKHALKKRKGEMVKRNLHIVHCEKENISKTDILVSWCKKKRTVYKRSYWLNGLLWTHDPADERGRNFREKKVVLPLQPALDVIYPMKCCLCHGDYNAGVIYVGCEICGDWFHGDAFGLELERMSNLAGFKCPKCRMKNVPACPFLKDSPNRVSKSTTGSNDSVELEYVELKKFKGEPQPESINCEDCSGFSGENGSHEKRKAILAHFNDDVLHSSEIKSDKCRTVLSPEHAEANVSISIAVVLHKSKTSHRVESNKGTSMVANGVMHDYCSDLLLEDGAVNTAD
ncbi:hypothetical protein HPP92_011768 [Vanilla planifolia]|uniref:Uncharacterized protein n=1 Tax=Vanilla planifolia TaxID=51239 RepID=A0A835V1B8_VANPL|nr:hypothetical protein HPP92_011768 [Vanilla planifolia]